MKHPDSDARFNALLEEMIVRRSPPDRRKSRRAASSGYNGTRTPSHTSEGASPKRGRVSRVSKASSHGVRPFNLDNLPRPVIRPEHQSIRTAPLRFAFHNMIAGKTSKAELWR